MILLGHGSSVCFVVVVFFVFFEEGAFLTVCVWSDQWEPLEQQGFL